MDGIIKKSKWNGYLKNYLRWPFYLGIFLAVVNLVVYFVSFRSGVIVSLGLALYFAVQVALTVQLKPRMLGELASFALQCESVEKDLLENLEVPYALMDYQGRIAWANHAFLEMTGLKKADWKKVENVLPVFPLETVALAARSAAGGSPETEGEETTEASPDTDILMPYKDHVYRIRSRTEELGSLVEDSTFFSEAEHDSPFMSVYFYDETKLRKVLAKSEEEKLVVGLAYLDNYEEALESVEEVRRSLLMALIERKVGTYFSDLDGLIRKTEKDKFFLVLNKGALDTLIEQKFRILEETKTVSMGNSMPLTLSIGLGIGGGSFKQNAEFARIAIEMALGRGGDQVVIKDGNQITYFGGKSLQMEKTTRVKARVKAQALKEIIASKEAVVVMGHKITDVDALGAAIGIYRAGAAMGKPVHIVVNDPTTSIRPLMAGFLDNPEYGPGMFIDSMTAKNLVDNNTVVVVVDTNKPSYTECKELLALTRTIVVLDHHRRGNEVIENAVLSYVEPYASSACEMVAEILQYFGEEMKLRSNEADCLYAGIVIDTNNFITRSGVRTFEAAAYLRRNGADTTRVRKMLRDNIDSYKAKAEAVRTAEIYRNYFAIGVCPSEGIESPTVVGAQAANELLNIAGVKASFVLTRFNSETYISARAIDEVNVQVLMEQLGGGGHLNIAGAQLKGTPEETKAVLHGIIDRFVQDGGLDK